MSDNENSAGVDPDTNTVGVVIDTPLSLGSMDVHAGQTLSAKIIYRNKGKAFRSIERLIITVRPSKATDAQNPQDNLAPEVGPLVVAPEDTVKLTATRRFTDSDAPGDWRAFSSVLDSSGKWSNGPALYFQVLSDGATPHTDGGHGNGHHLDGGRRD